ncbi:MAG TPA: hypothetical protein VFL79_11385 [Terriglobia bacterium]|nr:hypothetical protein [Terriglobia bacterium]
MDGFLAPGCGLLVFGIRTNGIVLANADAELRAAASCPVAVSINGNPITHN